VKVMFFPAKITSASSTHVTIL